MHCDFARTNVITTLTTVISTLIRVIYARRVWLWHAWCEYDTHERDNGTHECDLYTHELNFNMVRVNLTRKSKINVRLHYQKSPGCVIFTSCLWCWHPECAFGTLLVIWTIMRVIFTLIRMIFTLIRVIWTLMRVIWTLMWFWHATY
jgi:hypothetical protein